MYARSSRFAAGVAIALAVVCVATISVLTRQSETMELLSRAEANQGFPQWAHPIEPAILDRSIVNSRWDTDSVFPPYVAKLTMYAGVGVKKAGNGNTVRKLLKIKRQFRYHNWNTNNFISDFESPQMRFLSRGKDGFLVVPPLSSIPILNNQAVTFLNQFILEGANTLVVCGSPSSILFLNENIPGGDLSGFELDGAYSDGPFEQQKGAIGTQFQACATTMPGPAWGVDPASLPANAVSLYEAPGSSVAFIIPAGSGAIIYIGFDFEQNHAAWTEILQIAAGVAPLM